MSKIIDAWEMADFETAAAEKMNRHRRKQIRTIIRESRYACKLKELLETQNYEPAPQRAPLENEKPKVVTVLHASLPNHTGGYTGRAQGLLKGLLENGIEVAAYTRPGFYTESVDPKAAFPYPADEVDGITYRHLPTRFKRRSGEFEYMYESIEWYRSVFLFERPTIVHARSTYLVSLPALIAAHQLNIPVLYEVSGLWELVYEGRDETGRALRTAAMEDLVCRYADRVVTMNESIGNLLSQRAGGSLDFGVVPNAVDITQFSEITPLESKEEFNYEVGYIGSLVDYEGLDTLIEAIALARSQGSEIRAKIVGRGSEIDRLRALATEAGVDDIVHLPGPVPAAQSAAQFEDVNLIVLPRKRTPATERVTPLKPYEAMAAGRPLVVSSVSALEEVSNNGSFAEVFESENPTELARSLVALLGDRNRQVDLAHNAQEFVARERNWTAVGLQMANEIFAANRPISNLTFLAKSAPDMKFGKLRMGRVAK